MPPIDAGGEDRGAATAKDKDKRTEYLSRQHPLHRVHHVLLDVAFESDD